MSSERPIIIHDRDSQPVVVSGDEGSTTTDSVSPWPNPTYPTEKEDCVTQAWYE